MTRAWPPGVEARGSDAYSNRHSENLHLKPRKGDCPLNAAVSLVRTYLKLNSYFTATELQETVTFYGSPTGRKILGLGQRLDQAVGDAVETALEVHRDEFVERVDTALAETYPELAEGGS